MEAVVAAPPQLLRSAFFTPSSDSVWPAKSSNFPRRPNSFRKCRCQIPSAIPSGLSAELHDSFVQLHVGLLQKVVDVGLPLPANAGALNWLGLTVPAALWYLTAKPGSLSGLLDFAYAPVHSFSNISFDADEVQVGRQIGEGSFGIVYEGYIGRGVRKGTQKKEVHVILKKAKPQSRGAKEMRDAEVYINRRVQRTAPNACADFLGTTNVSASQSHGRLSEGLWLVWKYQGDKTLAYYMKQKNFPENVAEYVLGSKAKGTSKEEMTEQNDAVIRKIATQILTNIRDLHKTGLVHRDVKPLNLILAKDSGAFKLVDLGAAVDVRSGYNYVPDETIIDPTYAAPERHVMPTSTPQLPPDPLCSVVSPLVWLLNTPDRFDLYSAGLILLQMAVKPLRQDISLQQFNTEFKRAGYDLDAWRRRCRFSNDEFSLLDADGGAGWELVRSMLLPRHDRASWIWPSLGSSRPSAEAALRHRFLSTFGKLPSFKLPSYKLPSYKLPTLPSFELPSLPQIQPPNFIPTFSRDSLPRLGADGPGLDVKWGQLSNAISSNLPAVTTSALTLSTGWLIVTALRDSAQKSYAVGQWAVETLATIGPLSVVAFVLVRLWNEEGEKKRTKRKVDVNLGEPPRTPAPAGVDTGTYIEDSTFSHVAMSHLEHVREAATFPESHEAGETSQRIGLLAAANMESLHEATIQKLRSTRPQTGTLKYSATGLAEAVQTMELQLASLESSIAAGRLFAQQQQQQIIRMETLLTQRPQETVAAAKQSE